MEISGLDPEITICKIAVLPIKLYPRFSIINFSPKRDMIFLRKAQNGLLMYIKVKIIYMKIEGNINNYSFCSTALKMNRTSIKILTVFRSTIEL